VQTALKCFGYGLVLRGMAGRGPRRHFVLNTKTNLVEFVEPEDYAERIGVLREWEEPVGEKAKGAH